MCNPIDFNFKKAETAHLPFRCSTAASPTRFFFEAWPGLQGAHSMNIVKESRIPVSYHILYLPQSLIEER